MKRLAVHLQTVDKKWLILWVAIYISIVILASFFPNFIGNPILRIIGIALCVLYPCLKHRNDYLLIIALSFTLLADIILTIDDVSILGVITFCFAQFFHAVRLQKAKPISLVVYITIATIIFFIAVWLEINPMYAIAGIYAYALFFNLFSATRWYFSSRSIASICAASGFFLFVLCDICVALSYLGFTGVIPFMFKPLFDYFAWLFYYPSQVLISNSSNMNSFKKVKVSKNLH